MAHLRRWPAIRLYSVGNTPLIAVNPRVFAPCGTDAIIYESAAYSSGTESPKEWSKLGRMKIHSVSGWDGVSLLMAWVRRFS